MTDSSGTPPNPLLVSRNYFTFAQPPNEMILDCGYRLGPITLAYETLGELNAEGSNAILILHAFSGDSHVAGYLHENDDRPGWWDNMVGPGKPVDTNQYFVICSNILGGCSGSTGPSSINPETGRPYGLGFPMVTIKDMVRAQKHLIDHLGINKLMSLIGGSVGGMQVLRWCADYPEMIASAIPLATTTRHSAQAIAFNEVARQAIMADPNWNNGDYYSGPGPVHGLAVARMIGHVTYLSDEAMRDKFGRRLHRSSLSFDFTGDFQVESYLHHQGKKFVTRFDANSLLYITKAADYFDLERGNGSLLINETLADVSFLVISFSSDWLYPTYQSKDIVSSLKKNGSDVSFCEIEAQWGHDAFLLPNKRLNGLISGFLDRVYHEHCL
ncbi:homoserine O-acetyltransferase MetX [Desulfobulbus alkaliphilus]|uniref:homoserine O-acetyltransferase MetX n=1 Tax=Desulfobulbus alkaliphilus TaxID=869814 RepID=UPI00196603B1|nr:homoserine O-acetyltransferase [Desulfobulbus alkaliphilus]MBM9537010.1 homoserine O-acetyltransferase [Desulfobulbus alkaliphilus]